MKSPVLVTGGSGFIGGHLVTGLLERNLQVRVLDARPRTQAVNRGVEYVHGSILDRAVVRDCMRDVRVVFHTAAIAQLWTLDKADYDRVNHEGTRLVLEEAGKSGVERFVYTSTEAILRAAGDRSEALIRADRPLPPLEAMAGPYTRSKWLAEEAVRQAALDGFPAVIVYPTVPIGDGDVNMTAPTRMIRTFYSSPPPFVFDCRFNLVAVEDVARGHIRAAERGRPGDRFILGGENLRLTHFLQLLHECGGARPPKWKIPYAFAWLTGIVSQFVADHVTKRAPIASVEGIRLANTCLWCDTNSARSALELPVTPLVEAVARAVSWIDSPGE